MSKADKAIKNGAKSAGAQNFQFEKHGNKYRRASMEINGTTCTIFKIPTSSHLDESAIQRKARDMVRRFTKYNTTTLTW